MMLSTLVRKSFSFWDVPKIFGQFCKRPCLHFLRCSLIREGCWDVLNDVMISATLLPQSKVGKDSWSTGSEAPGSRAEQSDSPELSAIIVLVSVCSPLSFTKSCATIIFQGLHQFQIFVTLKRTLGLNMRTSGRQFERTPYDSRTFQINLQFFPTTVCRRIFCRWF